MIRRTVSLVVGLTLVASVLTIAPSFLGDDPAGAEGFNFLCEAPGGPPGEPSEFEQMANGLAIKILTDQAFWIFSATVPAGIPVTVPGAVTDPVTGETSFAIPIQPKLGFSQRLDFIDGAVVPGADGDEIRFGYAFRNKAGQRQDDLSMLELFTENYGLPLEPGNDINVTGVDIEFQTNEIMGQLEGFEGNFGAIFNYQLADGSTEAAAGNFVIDSKGPGYRIPEEATLSLSVRKPPDATASFIAFGQRAIHEEFDGTANQPGVGFGIDLARVDTSGGILTNDPFVSMDLSWGAAPQSLALGVGSLCPDKGHLAWNHSGLPDPAAASVDVDVAFGIEEGLPIVVDDGAGPEPRLANIMDVEGTIDGVPSQMDVIMLRDALSFTRSPDVAPDVHLSRLAMADDDPADPDDLPLHATADVDDIPRHLLMTVDREPDASIARGELTSWTLACPGEPAPPGPAAPEDLRRLDLPETLPSFPVGCVRHALSPVPSAEAVVQTWLPEDLLAQAAAADLAAPPLGSNQYGYVATRTVNSLSTDALLAFGGKINGIQRATFDLSEAPPDGERARVYLERVPAPAADDSIRVVADIDGRTSADEAANTGARFTTAATITDLPDRIRLDYQATPTAPLDLSWRADAPIAVVDGTFDAQLRGPDALRIHGAFETGAVGAGALPPAAHLAITDDGTGGSVQWNQPGPVTDAFPTPTVPPFDSTAITSVHAGAQISTLDERAAGIGIRVHGQLEVPQPVDVTWNTDADDELESFVASFCDPAAPVPCEGARLDGSAVKGLQSPLSAAELLTPPPLPVPSPEIAAAAAPFTDFRPSGSGVRGILLTPDLWGVDAVIDGITRAEFRSEPTDVVVQLANTTPQPFRINLLDASNTKLVEGVERPQVLSADALIDPLPNEIRVRYDDSDPTQPIVWVNTEDVDITDLAAVDFDATDPPGTRPVITGVIRLGDAAVLGLLMPVGNRPTDPRPATTRGVDLWAEFDTSNGLFGVDASTAVDLPRHVAIWEPQIAECGIDTPPVDACQGHPVYDIDETTSVDVLLKTTNETFGNLVINAGITGQANLQVHGEVGSIGGQIEGSVQIAKNRRLPWQTVNATMATNTALETVLVEVIDREYDFDRDDTNGNQQPAYRDASSSQTTTNYALSLTNVPRGIEVKGRLQTVEPRLHGLPAEPPSDDPCSPKRDEELPGPELGFMHAELDLGIYEDDEVAALGVDAREIDGNFAARLSSEEPITGFVNGLVENVRVVINADCDPVTGFDQFLVTAGGIALIGIGVAIGAIGGPIGAVIGGIIGGIIAGLLDLFSDAEVTLAIDLDVDLPFFLGFDDTTDIRAGLAGLTLSADEQSVAGDPAQIGFRQQSLAHEDPFVADGAFYNSRSTTYIGDDIPGIGEDWNASNTLTNQLADVGMLPWHDCNDYDTDDPCPTNGGTNVIGIDDFPSTPRDDGYSSTDILVDMFFNAGNRSHLADEDGGLADPGKEIYEGLAGGGQPFEVGAFDFSDLPAPPVAASATTFEFTALCCSDVTFVDPFDPSITTTQDFGPVCSISTSDGLVAGPRATGTDGTEYVVAVVPNQVVPNGAPRAFCDNTKFVLQATLPQSTPTLADERLGPPRWSVALPLPEGLEDGGACDVEETVFEPPFSFDEQGVRCDITITVTPQTDGSVQVVSNTTAVTNGADGESLDYDAAALFPSDQIAAFFCCPEGDSRDGDSSEVLATRRAWVDNSGHPGFFADDAALVDDFTLTTSGVAVGADGDVTLDPCALASWACDPGRGADERTRWVFGDGVVSDSIVGAPGVVTHRYPTTDGTDEFLGILVRLGPGCEDTEPNLPAIGTDCQVLDKTYFRVTT